MGKGILCKWKPKESRGSYTVSGKIDFNSKAVIRDKEGHYKMVERLFHQESLTIINIYAHNIGAPKNIKHIIIG